MVEPQAQEPSMQGNHDNLATTRHQHTENSRTMILTSYLPERGREGRELTETGKVQVRMS